jgi:hypothetical protein
VSICNVCPGQRFNTSSKSLPVENPLELPDAAAGGLGGGVRGTKGGYGDGGCVYDWQKRTAGSPLTLRKEMKSFPAPVQWDSKSIFAPSNVTLMGYAFEDVCCALRNDTCVTVLKNCPKSRPKDCSCSSALYSMGAKLFP